MSTTSHDYNYYYYQSNSTHSQSLQNSSDWASNAHRARKNQTSCYRHSGIEHHVFLHIDITRALRSSSTLTGSHSLSNLTFFSSVSPCVSQDITATIKIVDASVLNSTRKYLILFVRNRKCMMFMGTMTPRTYSTLTR